jgi:hypothetical protein
MKPLITALALLALTVHVHAEPFRSELPIVCDDTQSILRELAQDYKETFAWGGEHANDGSRLALFVNTKTGSWTLLKMTKRVSCILGVGVKSEMIELDRT